MAKVKILIVEDGFIVAEDLQRLVTKIGYEVVAVIDSGEEAVHVATTLRPDVVLMDVRLGGPMDGLTAGTLIEAAVGSALVYVTATPNPDRMRYYAPKPFSEAALASIIRSALEQRSQR